MTRITWAESGTRLFETGVDRGVLFVGSEPGVPWIGLIAVNERASGGKLKPRYLDGVMISNHAGPEQYEATVEAFSYPSQFEVCDGTASYENGLRAKRQPRKPFNMVYRTKLGSDIQGVDYAYKLHILYNLRAAPSDRNYKSFAEIPEPTTFSWDIVGRPEILSGLAATASFEIDSRTVPPELLVTIENMLYGDATQDPRLPSAQELLFLFDSFQDLVYDAGDVLTPVFVIHNAGSPSDPVTSTVDSGGV